MNWTSTKLWSEMAVGGAIGSAFGAFLPHFSSVPAVPMTSIVTSVLGIAVGTTLFAISKKR